VERLWFGRRARRRARWRRLTIGAWLVTMLASSLGVPTGMGFLGGLGERRIDPARMERSDAATSLLRLRGGLLAPPPRRASREAEERRSERSRPEERTEERKVSRPERERRARRHEAPAPEPTSVTEIVYAAAVEHGVDPDYLLSVASCESDLDPEAHSGAGYHGLFQFDQETWAAYGYGSIYDAAAQADTAARLFAAGHSERWPNCA
jgi:soluble lytic murein transglycosylase-like protein